MVIRVGLIKLNWIFGSRICVLQVPFISPRVAYELHQGQGWGTMKQLAIKLIIHTLPWLINYRYDETSCLRCLFSGFWCILKMLRLFRTFDQASATAGSWYPMQVIFSPLFAFYLASVFLLDWDACRQTFNCQNLSYVSSKNLLCLQLTVMQHSSLNNCFRGLRVFKLVKLISKIPQET